LAALVWLCAGAGIAAPPQVYWNDYTGIYRANIDGSGVTQLIAAGGIPNLAVDPVGGKLYFGQLGDPFINYTSNILRANLDGSGIEVVLPGRSSLSGMDLDLVNGKIYFADYDGTAETAIYRVNFDGSNLEPLFNRPDYDGLKYDPVEDKVYQLSLDDDFVARSNSDGSQREGLPGGTSLGLDLVNRKLYSTGAYSLFRSNLDGSDFEELLPWDDSEVMRAFRYSVAVDPVGGHLFIGGYYGDIFRTNLDGSDLQTIVSGHDGLRSIVFVVPEPSSLVMLSLGLSGLVFFRRRKVR
jgi:hypothetical protein